MKKLTLTFSLIAGFITLISFNTPVKDETYVVDTQRSTIDWKANKVGGGHTGTIKIEEGSLVHNGKTLVGGNFLINMASITSDNETVTKNLKSDNFFVASKYPTSKFEITKVAAAGKDRVSLTGNLTIKGITLPITFPATVKMQKDIVVAVANGIRIDRTKYDIKFRSKTFFMDIGDRAVDDEFELNINLVAKKK